MKRAKPTAPVIARPIVQKDIFIGTMNPNALSQPLLQRKNIHKSYEQLSQLTEELESLKNENAELQSQLDSMLNVEEPPPYCKFKKWIVDFRGRLKDRENELSAFSKYIDSYRKESAPTFVKVDAANVRPPDFDSICVSLLVANPEKYFFCKDDLLQLNQQLSVLIDQQADALKLLNARLRLFSSYQNKATVTATIESLKKNQMPSTLAAAAPTRALELKTKKKLLKAELAILVKARRDLTDAKLAKRNKLRKKRHKIKMSILINKMIRGYLVRNKLKQMKKSAVIIQKVWRGFIQRYHQKSAENHLDEFDSEGRRYRMVKIYKSRINPDGEEEEYYEYEEEEIKEGEEENVEEKKDKGDQNEEEEEEEEDEEEIAENEAGDLNIANEEENLPNEETTE